MNITEKERRVYYQDLVYKAANRIDGALGGTTITGTAEHPSDNFIERLEELIKKGQGNAESIET